jgi:hypothetical protein
MRDHTDELPNTDAVIVSRALTEAFPRTKTTDNGRSAVTVPAAPTTTTAPPASIPMKDDNGDPVLAVPPMISAAPSKPCNHMVIQRDGHEDCLDKK